MRPVRAFLRLSGSDKVLFLRAVTLVGAIRVGLWVMPLKDLRRLLSRARSTNAGTGRRSEPETPEQIAAAVRRASRVVPKATCLPRALAIQSMMSQRGMEASLHIGVASTADKPFGAHAWIEHEGTVIDCGSDPSDFQSLVVMGSRS